MIYMDLFDLYEFIWRFLTTNRYGFSACWHLGVFYFLRVLDVNLLELCGLSECWASAFVFMLFLPRFRRLDALDICVCLFEAGNEDFDEGFAWMGTCKLSRTFERCKSVHKL